MSIDVSRHADVRGSSWRRITTQPQLGSDTTRNFAVSETNNYQLSTGDEFPAYRIDIPQQPVANMCIIDENIRAVPNLVQTRAQGLLAK